MTQWGRQPEFESWNLHGVRRKLTLSDPHIYAVACVHGHTHVYTRKREKHRTLVPSKGVALTPASADCLPR